MDNETAGKLIEAVEGLGKTVSELTEKVDALEAKLDEPDGGELSEDEVKDIVSGIIDEVRTATTGALPE